MGECACASVIFTSFNDFHPWFVWIPSIWNGPLLLTFFHSYVYCWIVLVWCCWRGYWLCQSQFRWCYQQLFSSAFQQASCWQKIDIVSKPPVATQSSSNGHSRQWGVNFFCIFFWIICKLVILWLRQRCRSICMILSKNRINSTRDNGHPYHTSTVIRKKSQTLPFKSMKSWKSSFWCSKYFSTNTLEMRQDQGIGNSY